MYTILASTRIEKKDSIRNPLSLQVEERMRHTGYKVLSFLAIVFLFLLNIARELLMKSDYTAKLLFVPGMEKLRRRIGKMKAWNEFRKAAKNVPAYSAFLLKHKRKNILFNPFNPDLSAIPVIDKENYVKVYSLPFRCVGGTIPSRGVVIDESSGSSGVPTNWVRGVKERKTNKRFLEFSLKNLIGNEPVFIINAFALGPWATGMNVSMSFASVCMLKSLGPDIPKILNTLKMFGKQHHYLIMGYPPFLKSLVDEGDIPWQEYNITLISGGEGTTQSMREYMLKKGIKRMYSSFGASDLELNIASENDFTNSLRKLLSENETLAAKILKFGGSLPMIFQYNPADFFIESNEENELLISICRPGYIAPKIRYNIHDKGHVMYYSELIKIFGENGINTDSLYTSKTDLPLLFHYGRADMAVAFYGCKISPVDIQETIFRIPALATHVSSFLLKTHEDEALNKKLTVCMELNETTGNLGEEDFRVKFFSVLREINQDFRESTRMLPAGCEPALQFYNKGQGPFANADIRIKRKYIEE